VLAEYVEPFDSSRLDCSGATVAITGGAPSLADETDAAADADRVFAASTAVDVLVEARVDVDLMVTDLDKNPDTARRLTETGVPVAAHAHGDNVPAVREHVPTFDAAHVLGTTQAEPAGPVRNFGGFTDGDRAAFLADHCGAAELVFPGGTSTTRAWTRRRRRNWRGPSACSPGWRRDAGAIRRPRRAARRHRVGRRVATRRR